ncbi:Peroxiredoxin-like 2A [Camellia lanceoleosa]|uniref:Peroxiredoxin-like 2A n=1 Tax=Camellia lanceoleosa TaxID=1840588 RepID=A0ACC0G0B2_9ERIC|nr:Peroxiredoxin-like 2A [Camellia lanceoleosa]
MQSMTRSPARSSTNYDVSAEQSMVDLKIKDGHIFKGIVAAAPAEPRACGCVQPPPIVDNVAPYSAIENITIQKLTTEYKIGMECLVKTKTPTMKASELWRDKPAVLVSLGGGKLLKDKFISGFLFNPRAIANYKRAKATGMEQNFKGEGEIKGGLFIVSRGRSGIAYQFIERNFGDWAPLPEVIEICTQLQNQQQSQWESSKTTQENE